MGAQFVQDQVQKRVRIVLIAAAGENLQVAARMILEEQRGRVATEGDPVPVGEGGQVQAALDRGWVVAGQDDDELFAPKSD